VSNRQCGTSIGVPAAKKQTSKLSPADGHLHFRFLALALPPLGNTFRHYALALCRKHDSNSPNNAMLKSVAGLPGLAILVSSTSPWRTSTQCARVLPPQPTMIRRKGAAKRLSVSAWASSGCEQALILLWRANKRLLDSEN